ncbi:23S rRNA pseudouridine(1911/1915/1917) synthase RluD [Glaciecola petra]|uniref:Pseudouridine synthase n=1 Tax=Glaciecola petra TaxID=3075602 RepID=A0ABU2ZU31_9ALTE|nr:23S rRNA pseudouridine(1911/1915/1917) synthase RluD [Aestuariibacter sp. P117]MDT0595766.1 23S rRNA pseudouridine(1911/1915/1917) synthase RluD [Aestuariibacter sp. P117]
MSQQVNEISLNAKASDDLYDTRLDQSIARLFPEYSRSKLKEWILAGKVKLNNEIVTTPRLKLKGGEEIEISAMQEVQVTNQAQDIKLDIVHEDDDIIIINKPADLVVHPGAGNTSGTILNALLNHYPDIENVPRAGIVHRLDKDTTGLMVVAKTLSAQTQLVKQLQAREMGREYEALVLGNMIAGGIVDENIDRHATKRTLMAVRQTGKEAVTHYRVKKKYRAHTHIRLKLETGRTHQIRVHMAHIKHPIVGDIQYGGRPRLPKNASSDFVRHLQSFKRQALHAIQLSLTHPTSEENLSWSVAIPNDMQKLLVEMGKDLEINDMPSQW